MTLQEKHVNRMVCEVKYTSESRKASDVCAAFLIWINKAQAVHKCQTALLALGIIRENLILIKCFSDYLQILLCLETLKTYKLNNLFSANVESVPMLKLHISLNAVS